MNVDLTQSLNVRNENLATKMKFQFKKSQLSIKFQFKEWKLADGDHSLNRDLTVQ